MRYTLLLLFCLVYKSPFAQREKFNFNSDWKLLVGDDSSATQAIYNDATWKLVTLPHAWNEDEAFKKDIIDLSTGIAWYRKYFRLPYSFTNKKVFIEFEGVRQAAEIYINGKYVALHENGITAFGFDITTYLNINGAMNVIAVKTNNSWDYREKATNTKFQWSDKNFNANYGGIPKNVYLHVTENIYQTLPLYSFLNNTGVYIYANNFNIANKSATINVQSQIKNETQHKQTVQLKATLKDINNKIVKTFLSKNIEINVNATQEIKISSKVSNLNFWSWGYGYLYTVETSIIYGGREFDKVITTTGFRKTEFKNGMFFLNDRVMQFHGYAQRTSNEWPAIGMCVPPWLSDYSNKLMVEGNANLVRWMHITPWKQDIESCDRVGLLQAMPAGDSEKDVDGIRWKQRLAVMKDAIIYNRNNPSIIFYECGNENISEQHMLEMKNIRDEFDANGGRAIGSREMLDSKFAEYGGEMLYINKSATKSVWAMEYSRDEGLRKYWDDYTPPYHKDGDGPLHKGLPAKEYNHNQESHALENITRWIEYYNERPGTGKRVSSGGVNICFSESNTHHRGSENYRRCGEVDALRIIKQNYYANQIMWNGWVDIEKPGIHIIGHWNYEHDVTKTIYVVSSAAKVELMINGVSKGFGKQINKFLFAFENIHWQAGSIGANGFDDAGKIICNTKIETADKPYAVKLTAINKHNNLLANGHDVALIEVEVVDIKGRRCPTAMNLIQFSLNGVAEWRGGMAQGENSFILSKQLPVECGVNRVLIRSTINPGIITLNANADNLLPAQIILNSNIFKSVDGLSNLLPSVNTKLNLDKGPTPATPSFTKTRNALNIINVKAGANMDSAYKSFDDNELTDWYNDGKIETAWIEFELDKISTINEVNLKLNNFRSRVYPLKITIDGVEVFNDTTQKSLGYYNAICKPAKGKFVKIELANLNSNKETINTNEVAGKSLDDGVVRKNSSSKGTLSLIEVEIYETIK